MTVPVSWNFRAPGSCHTCKGMGGDLMRMPVRVRVSEGYEETWQDVGTQVCPACEVGAALPTNEAACMFVKDRRPTGHGGEIVIRCERDATHVEGGICVCRAHAGTDAVELLEVLD